MAGDRRNNSAMVAGCRKALALVIEWRDHLIRNPETAALVWDGVYLNSYDGIKKLDLAAAMYERKLRDPDAPDMVMTASPFEKGTTDGR